MKNAATSKKPREEALIEKQDRSQREFVRGAQPI